MAMRGGAGCDRRALGGGRLRRGGEAARACLQHVERPIHCRTKNIHKGTAQVVPSTMAIFSTHIPESTRPLPQPFESGPAKTRTTRLQQINSRQENRSRATPGDRQRQTMTRESLLTHSHHGVDESRRLQPVLVQHGPVHQSSTLHPLHGHDHPRGQFRVHLEQQGIYPLTAKIQYTARMVDRPHKGCGKGVVVEVRYCTCRAPTKRKRRKGDLSPR